MKTTTPRRFLGLIILLILLILIGYQSWLAVRRQQRPERIEVTEQLFEGVSYQRKVRETPRPLVIHLLQIDLTHPDIKFLVTPGDLEGEFEISARTTSQFLLEFDTQLAINGSFFEPFRAGAVPWDYYPKRGDPVDINGLAISNGLLYSEANTRDPNLCIMADSVQIMQSHCPPETRQALSGNRRLLWNGEMDSFTNNKVHPRSAVAIDTSGETLWLIVVDGRQEGYSEGVTLAELAALTAELGVDRAINLDGGGSSTLVMREGAGARVLNAPIHQGIPMLERPVGNHLGIYAREVEE